MKSVIKKFCVPLLVTSYYLLATRIVYAQTICAAGKLCDPAPGAGLTLQDFILLLIKIVQLVLIPALVVVIIYSGFKLVTAGGNETEITKAKQWILWSVGGGGIILGATVIAQLVFNTAAVF